MSYRELIDALHQEADATIARIWQDAEEEAGRIRDGAVSRGEHLRTEHQKRQREALDHEGEALLHEGGRQEKRIRLTAEKECADRCYCLALRCLENLRNEDYPELFQQLVHELPRNRWSIVRVNPLDIRVALSHFPGATVTADPSISGGFVAMTDDEKIRVSNTFEKRLERAWAELVPDLLKDIRHMVS